MTCLTCIIPLMSYFQLLCPLSFQYLFSSSSLPPFFPYFFVFLQELYPTIHNQLASQLNPVAGKVKDMACSVVSSVGVHMWSSWSTIHRFFPLLQVFNIFKIPTSQSDLAEIASLVAKILECILFFFPLRNRMKYTLKSAEHSKADPVVTISPSAWEIGKIHYRQSKGLFNLYKAVRGKKI